MENICQKAEKLLFLIAGDIMGKQRIKRIADFLEKLAVAGIALGIFQNNYSGMWLAGVFVVVSVIATREA
ncbi:hypothetical protein LJC09_04615 [Desulfovibrio sp. OttesenSCG-928-F20]|nr:hypothetical protein [Desulfovibrio sp. OttesenSCG-928-F20]